MVFAPALEQIAAHKKRLRSKQIFSGIFFNLAHKLTSGLLMPQPLL
jgi:hypothetical protein